MSILPLENTLTESCSTGRRVLVSKFHVQLALVWRRQAPDSSVYSRDSLTRLGSASLTVKGNNAKT